MNTLRAQLIVLAPAHEPLGEPLVENKHNLRRDLRTEKVRLVKSRLLPLSKIVRHLRQPDARRRLPVARVLRLPHAARRAGRHGADGRRRR